MEKKAQYFYPHIVYEFPIKINFLNMPEPKLIDMIQCYPIVVSHLLEEFIDYHFDNMHKQAYSHHFDYTDSMGLNYELKSIRTNKKVNKNVTFISRNAKLLSYSYKNKSEKYTNLQKKEQDINYYIFSDFTSKGLISLKTVSVSVIKSHYNKTPIELPLNFINKAVSGFKRVLINNLTLEANEEASSLTELRKQFIKKNVIDEKT